MRIQELVGQRGLAGAAGAGDAEDRRPVQGLGRLTAQARNRASSPCSSSEMARARLTGSSAHRRRCPRTTGRGDARTRRNTSSIMPTRPSFCRRRRVDLLDAVGLELLDLVRGDRAAAADDDADVGGALGLQHVHHVPEVLVVPALVAADGDAVGVLLDRRPHDVLDAAVVAEVHDFGAVRLQDPADDVDRGVVAVEQGGGADEAQRPAGIGGGLVDPFGRTAHLNSPARRWHSLALQSGVPRCCHAGSVGRRRE